MVIKTTSTASDIDAILSGDKSTLRDRLIKYVKHTNKYLYIIALSSGFMLGLLAMLGLIILNHFLK